MTYGEGGPEVAVGDGEEGGGCVVGGIQRGPMLQVGGGIQQERRLLARAWTAEPHWPWQPVEGGLVLWCGGFVEG